MDDTAKRLLKRLEEIEHQRWRLADEEQVIKKALSIAGLRPAKVPALADPHEADYTREKPFRKTTLAESCKRVLSDYREEWLTKSQVEYLVVRGGYNFQTDKTKNSVHVTLRRLAEDGKCMVERIRGSKGNRYRYHYPIRSPRELEEKQMQDK